MEQSDFPVFRRMQGSGNYYRIESANRFTELQRIGDRWAQHEVVATMYPEMVRILEMIGMDHGRYELLDEQEWRRAEDAVRAGPRSE